MEERGYGAQLAAVWRSLREAGLDESEWLETLTGMTTETLAQLVAAAAAEYKGPPAPADGAGAKAAADVQASTDAQAANAKAAEAKVAAGAKAAADARAMEEALAVAEASALAEAEATVEAEAAAEAKSAEEGQAAAERAAAGARAAAEAKSGADADAAGEARAAVKTKVADKAKALEDADPWDLLMEEPATDPDPDPDPDPDSDPATPPAPALPQPPAPDAAAPSPNPAPAPAAPAPVEESIAAQTMREQQLGTVAPPVAIARWLAATRHPECCGRPEAVAAQICVAFGQAWLKARSHCRFAPPFIHFIPYSLTYSVPLCLKRQCDRPRRGTRSPTGCRRSR
jgi:hypothetical protein